MSGSRSMTTRQGLLALCLVLLLSAALPHASARHASGRTVLAKIDLENGEVDSSAAFSPAPPGRTCHSPGENCYGNTQCCSKTCDTLYFHCD